jgi:hypothetical protein
MILTIQTVVFSRFDAAPDQPGGLPGQGSFARIAVPEGVDALLTRYAALS